MISSGTCLAFLPGATPHLAAVAKSGRIAMRYLYRQLRAVTDFLTAAIAG
jgi:hypothetical protein